MAGSIAEFKASFNAELARPNKFDVDIPIPIGMVLGGGLVTLSQDFLSRESALRAPYLLGAILGVFIFLIAAPRLTSSAIEKARADAKK